jgi:signal transduction histidine kinase
MAAIVLLEAAGERRVEVGEGIVIGRDPSSDLPLEDPMVSLRHAQVIRTESGYEIRDLGSRHGTYVGDDKVETIRLKDGDEILLGLQRLRFDEAAPQAAGVPRRTTTWIDSFDAAPASKVGAARAGFRPAAEIEDEAELRADYEKLRAALAIASAAGAEREVRPLLERILHTAIAVIGAERTAAVLVDPKDGTPFLRLELNRNQGEEPASLSTKLLSEVMRRGEGVLVTGGVIADRRSESMAAQGIRSAMCSPLLYRDEVLGVLYVDSRIFERRFQDKDLEVLAAFANQAAASLKAALSIEEVDRVRSSERSRMQQVLRTLQDGVILVDGEHRIAFANDAALRLAPALGISPDQPVPDPLAGIRLTDLTGGGGRVHRHTTATSPRRIFELTGARAVDEQGGEGCLLVIRDVTEERTREQQAERQERLATIGKLVAGVAHDFNNLLTVILTSADGIEQGPPDEVPALTRDITEAGSRAARLTRQLLVFSSASAGTVEVVDVGEMATEIARMWSRLLAGRMHVVVRGGPSPARVLIDRAHLEQILLNLIVNARDATAPGGHLWLDVRVEERGGERWVALTATDDGSGMDPEVARRIFEPFFTTKGHAGTGLGLATVQRVVRAAGGTIEVESEPGRGTSFRIRLPATDAIVVRRRSETEQAGRLRATVLVVEAHAAVRDASARALRSARHTVLAAPDGEQALRLAEQHGWAIDLLVAGLVMPGMTGEDLAAALRPRCPRLRVLYTSGYFDDSVVERAARDGADFLAKPYGGQTLCDRVASCLAEPVVP